MQNFERLSDDIYIEVTKEHTFGTDALLLSYFARPKIKDSALDMGTGCGIIPFLWLRKSPPHKLHGRVRPGFSGSSGRCTRRTGWAWTASS